MAKPINKLSWREVPKLAPGWHGDGQGLYVRVEETGSRRWVYVTSRLGKRRELGLGSADTVKIADARAAAADARELIRKGVDPIETRRALLAPPPESKTFGEVAGLLMDTLEPEWKSAKQRPQWEASLKQNAPAGSVSPNRLPRFRWPSSLPDHAQIDQSVSLFRQLAGGDPDGGDDVREVPAVAPECGGPAGRARHRHLP